MKVLREGKFNTEAYITKKVDYETILTAFDDWASPLSKEIKVVYRLGLNQPTPNQK
jgi:hypothetical protein